MTGTIVDCHSHVFNGEDLPIDGFLRRVSRRPDIIDVVYSVPLDRLAQWLASKADREAEYLAALLDPGGALESSDVVPPPQAGSDLVSDKELDELFLHVWKQRGLINATDLAALEGTVDTDELLAEGIAKPEAEADREELEAWLRDLGDPELDAQLAEEDALEGPKDWISRMRSMREAAHRWAYVVRLATKDRHLVASELATTYPEVSLFVPALVDFEHTASDKPSSPVTRQVLVHSLVGKVSMQGKIPGAPNVRIHPLVGYCPYREVATSELRGWQPSTGEENPYVPFADLGTAGPDDRWRPGLSFDHARARTLTEPIGPWRTGHLQLADVTRSLDIVRHAVEHGGFVGVKIYPPAGYLPLGNASGDFPAQGERLDAALRALYAYCVAMDVPVLAHANASNAFAKGYDDLAGPAGWRLVLAEFPELRVCFGHFGHLHGVGEDPGHPDADAWVRGFVQLIDDYPNVYADVSNSKLPVVEEYREQYLRLLGWMIGTGSPDEQQARRRTRVMFGTDWWMNTMAPLHRTYLSVFQEHFQTAFGDDALAAFMGGNALRWLGFTDDPVRPGVQNANRERLRTFYGSLPTPAWLA